MINKPRNPLVAAAKFRRAGAHQKTEKARRRQENVALQRSLRTLHDSRSKGNEEVFLSVVRSLNAQEKNLLTISRTH